VPPTPPQPIVDRMDIGIAQGFVEDSNVDPVREITQLIQVQRAFERVSALINDSETALDKAIVALGPK
jgi:flagellar basal-body rod protein FlgF